MKRFLLAAMMGLSAATASASTLFTFDGKTYSDTISSNLASEGLGLGVNWTGSVLYCSPSWPGVWAMIEGKMIALNDEAQAAVDAGVIIRGIPEGANIIKASDPLQRLARLPVLVRRMVAIANARCRPGKTPVQPGESTAFTDGRRLYAIAEAGSEYCPGIGIVLGARPAIAEAFNYNPSLSGERRRLEAVKKEFFQAFRAASRAVACDMLVDEYGPGARLQIFEYD